MNLIQGRCPLKYDGAMAEHLVVIQTEMLILLE